MNISADLTKMIFSQNLPASEEIAANRGAAKGEVAIAFFQALTDLEKQDSSINVGEVRLEEPAELIEKSDESQIQDFEQTSSKLVDDSIQIEPQRPNSIKPTDKRYENEIALSLTKKNQAEPTEEKTGEVIIKGVRKLAVHTTSASTFIASEIGAPTEPSIASTEQGRISPRAQGQDSNQKVKLTSEELPTIQLDQAVPTLEPQFTALFESNKTISATLLRSETMPTNAIAKRPINSGINAEPIAALTPRNTLNLPLMKGNFAEPNTPNRDASKDLIEDAELLPAKTLHQRQRFDKEPLFTTLPPSVKPTEHPVLLDAQVPQHNIVARDTLTSIDPLEGSNLEKTVTKQIEFNHQAPIVNSTIAEPFRAEPKQAQIRMITTNAPAISDAIIKVQDVGGKIDVSLSPDDLGRLTVKLDHSTNGPLITFSAERNDTQELMRRHIDILQTQMKSMGFENLSFSFARDQREQSPQTGRNQVLDTVNYALESDAAIASNKPPISIHTGLDIRI